MMNEPDKAAPVRSYSRAHGRAVGRLRNAMRRSTSACARSGRQGQPRWPDVVRIRSLAWLAAFTMFAAPALALPACADGLPETTIGIGEQAITAEVANTPDARIHGLMQRERMAENHGMIFVFDEAAPYSIWMKDTPLPLAVAFIDARGTILNITEMTPLSLDTHTAGGDALYALEMNRGWFTRHGIKSGDKVERLENVPAAVSR